MAVTVKELQKVAINKAIMETVDKRETTVVIQGGEIIAYGDKLTTKKPNKPFRNTYKATDDFVAEGLRAVLADYFKNEYKGSFARKGTVIVNEKENDYAITVSKIKFNVEQSKAVVNNLITKEVVSLVNKLDTLFLVQESNSTLVVSTPNFQQYQIRITKKRDRVAR